MMPLSDIMKIGILFFGMGICLVLWEQVSLRLGTFTS